MEIYHLRTIIKWTSRALQTSSWGSFEVQPSYMTSVKGLKLKSVLVLFGQAGCISFGMFIISPFWKSAGPRWPIDFHWTLVGKWGMEWHIEGYGKSYWSIKILSWIYFEPNHHIKSAITTTKWKSNNDT